MIFDPFEWPIVPDYLSVEVDIRTWKVLRSSRGALRSPDVKTIGHWCLIKNKPLYLYQEKTDLIIHYNGKTSQIPKFSKSFSFRERSFV